MSVVVGCSVTFTLKRGLMSVLTRPGAGRILAGRIALNTGEEERLVALDRPTELHGVIDEFLRDRPRHQGSDSQRPRPRSTFSPASESFVYRIENRPENAFAARLRDRVDDGPCEAAVLRRRTEAADSESPE